MSIDFSFVFEVACLEQALLSDLSKTQELDRIEKSLQTVSDQVQELINQLQTN